VPLPANVACPTCAYLAIVVRDLDGDHIPDVVAINTQLDLLVALSTHMMKLEEQRPIVPVNAPFTALRVSVSGAQLR
jgi:Ni,Fe-hydrogenase III large subunit